MIDPKDWKWHGLPGHFIAVSSCIFRLHTSVGKYRISTVGAMYREDHKGKKTLEEIGLNRHYETFVFDNEKIETEGMQEIDSDGLFLGAKAKSSSEEWDKKAEKMHIDMCLKYAEVQ